VKIDRKYALDWTKDDNYRIIASLNIILTRQKSYCKTGDVVTWQVLAYLVRVLAITAHVHTTA